MKSLITKLKGYWFHLLNFFAWVFQWIILFKPYWKKFTRFLVNWHEIVSIPIGVAVFYYVPMLLRMLDPTSGGYDLGILHSVVFAMAAMLMIHGFAFLLLKVTFPGIYQFIDDILEHFMFKDSRIDANLTHYQKCVISLSVLALYLLGTVLLVRIF
jgi:hypothetical protein